MIKNDLFLRALKGETVDRPPVWMMRQAGRYLPEFMEIREKYDFFTRCRTPELASEITVQPIRRYGMDAAILFSDILYHIEGLGLPLKFDPGPKFEWHLTEENWKDHFPHTIQGIKNELLKHLTGRGSVVLILENISFDLLK